MISLSWDFFTEKNFWVLAVLLLCVGAVVGLAFSGNLPEVIDLTESQEQSIILREERECAKDLREIQRAFGDKVDDLDDGLDRCFGRNREITDEFGEVIESLEDSVVGKIEDLNSSIVDLNALVSDWNCG